MLEEWKDIPGYEGLYQASDYGNIRSLYFGKIRVLKKVKDTHGYHMVKLFNEGYKWIKVHTLVALAFIGEKGDREMVNHKNRARTDNRPENLEWCTHLENMCHKSKTTNKKKTSKYIGVSLEKGLNMWKSGITIKGKLINLGRYKTEEEAYAARVNYEKENGIINKYL